MELRPGKRVRVTGMPVEGDLDVPCEAVVLERRLRDVLREGGGNELLLVDWRVEADNGDQAWVHEAGLQELE